MLNWFRRWQDRRLDKLCVKVVDRIEALKEPHKPVEPTYTDDYWPNRNTTFKLKDIAHVKMKNPQRVPPNQKRNRK